MLFEFSQPFFYIIKNLVFGLPFRENCMIVGLFCWDYTTMWWMDRLSSCLAQLTLGNKCHIEMIWELTETAGQSIIGWSFRNGPELLIWTCMHVQLCYLVRMSYGNHWKTASSSTTPRQPNTQCWKELLRQNASSIFGNVSIVISASISPDLMLLARCLLSPLPVKR